MYKRLNKEEILYKLIVSSRFITIKENVQVEVVEKKSKFIANLFYVENIEQAENIIKSTKKQYFDSRHNCIAYRIIDDGRIIEKSSDDGEPSGTAGAPMLNILSKNNLVNVLIIVTRYFGGILLGTGGLVRAYSESLIKAIEKSTKLEIDIGMQMEIVVEYSQFERFKYYCRNNEINIINSKYEENIICIIELEEDKKSKLMQDYETKKLNIKQIKELSKKYITKNI